MKAITNISFLLAAFLGCSLLGLSQSVAELPQQISGPCGDPTRESMFWADVDGKVVKVLDGNTILIVTGKKKQALVHLAGIAAPTVNQRLGREAQRFLEAAVLSKVVTVLVNPSTWFYKRPRPKEISGVVQLQSGEQQDVNLALIKAGLARYREPEPYSMSNYTACQYKIAEAGARAAKLGLW
jgi:micrococcal nuclease